jgi:hypothetical protein
MFIVIWVNPRPEQRGARRAGEAGRPKAAVRGRRLLADVVWTAFLQASTRNVCTRKFGVSFVARADARGAATDCSQSRGHSSGCCNGNPRLPSRAKSLRFVKASCVRFGDAIYHLLAQAGEHLVSKRDRCGLPMQEKLGGRLVPRVEKRHGHVKNLGESTRDFVARVSYWLMRALAENSSIPALAASSSCVMAKRSRACRRRTPNTVDGASSFSRSADVGERGTLRGS